MSGAVPDDLQHENFRWLGLWADEARQLEQVRAAIADDLRFEHMKDQAIDAATWRFVCQAADGRDGTPELMSHMRELETKTCYFEVELLTVQEELELHGVKLVPREVPIGDEHRVPGCIAAVPCVGTSRKRMMERARPLAEHAVRILRATLRESNFMPDRQLRFRVGYVYWFDDGLPGWSSPPEQGWELELDAASLAKAQSAALYRLPPTPTNDVERRTMLALRWFERAQLATDPTVELLFCFTALEAILGNKADGLKGHALALRRALLGLRTEGHFRHPSSTYLLYDQVRSAAIHGEEPPVVSQREVDAFAWDARRALNEFLAFAAAKDLTSRKRVRAALDADPKRDELLTALVEQDPRSWKAFVARQEKQADAKIGTSMEPSSTDASA